MEKRIVNFEDYGITDDGKVISYKYKIPKVLKTWYQASGYENIKLCKNNKTERHKTALIYGYIFFSKYP